MQTFLPYPDFRRSFVVLDWKRLGKQRVEAMQIINAITGVPRKDGKVYKGWVNHPCSVMWRDYVPALKLYHNVCIDEWVYRGYNNNMVKYDLTGVKIVMPHWFGDPAFHASHRANLMRKDFEFYARYGWTENPNDPYRWMDENGKWYDLHSGTGKRVYIEEVEEKEDIKEQIEKLSL